MTEPERLEGFPGRHWYLLEDGRIQCDVRPRYCRLNEGQRGLCFARGRQDDRIVLRPTAAPPDFVSVQSRKNR
ncbi:hypothetical protein [Bradyrhizobium sp. NAS96.2]|uniref:hypothetical protein n=1 Tax=Bradyrhizobium sp. NAS96.2 TaxID=1680160 RepID=UPI001AED0D57|nr:hypothetical protein [Bradyrhizobium sp. NAS96.2]